MGSLVYSLKMRKFFFCAGALVLCHSSISFGQIADSSKTDSVKRKVYEETKNPEKPEQERSHLGAIATLGAGPYTGFHDGGKYGSFFQPNLGFEFLAEPQGSLHFLLGGHIGFVNAFTTGISFGLRLPIKASKPYTKL